MPRSLLVLAAALALGASGCSPKCGPSTCTGCCDAQGVCQAPTADHCGQSGGACTTCVGFQLCLVGVCQVPGGAASTSSGAGSASGTAASASATATASSSAGSSSGASSAGSASGSAGSAAGSTGAASSGSTSTSSASAGSTSAASSAAGSTGTSSAASTTAASTSSAGTTSSSSTGTTGGGTTGGTSSSSSSSSSGGTTGGLLPICASCASSANCASGYCDTTTHTCNSAFACVPSDCAPYACGGNGSCVCGAGPTSSSSSGSSSSGGTSGGGRAICAPCGQNSDCASNYCNTFDGFCDSTLACHTSADCGGVACDTLTGSCLCGGGTTGTTGTSGTTGGTTGGSSGGTTGGAVDQCGVSRRVVGCTNGTCPQGYTCNAGACELNGASGALQVTLRWGTTDDLDIHLIEPGGCEIYYGHRTCTGSLDLDSNSACTTSPTSDENVIFNGSPAAGTYTVKADFWESCVNQEPVPYEVVVRKGGSETVTCGTFHLADVDHGGAGAGATVTTFTYP